MKSFLLLALFACLGAFLFLNIKSKVEERARMTPEERYMDEMGYEYVTIGGKKFIRNCNGNTKTYGQLTPIE